MEWSKPINMKGSPPNGSGPRERSSWPGGCWGARGVVGVVEDVGAGTGRGGGPKAQGLIKVDGLDGNDRRVEGQVDDLVEDDADADAGADGNWGLESRVKNF